MTSVSRQHALASAERLLNTEKILAAGPAGGFLNGLAGTALLHARLAAVDPVFAQAALRHWAAAAQNPGPHRGAAGIFSSPGGLAASLIIGSAYLPDPDPQRAATARAVPADLWDVEGPTLCHGYAGVLQSATTSQDGISDSAAAAVAEAFSPRLVFAFRHLDKGAPSDEPGLLTGSAGVALTLADHGQLPAPPVPARWDSVLLLS